MFYIMLNVYIFNLFKEPLAINVFDIGILQPFLHQFFVQCLFEAFAIDDFYVLLYHAFC
jgi:hypothetical protein